MQNKVLVSIHGNGYIQDFDGLSPFKSFIGLRLDKEWPIVTNPQKSICDARTNAVEEAMRLECTHVMMIDTDHTFLPDLVDFLLADDKDIVGAVAYKRTPPYFPCVFAKKEDEDFYRSVNVAKKGVMRCDAIGFGAVLIKMDVFFKIPMPWFWIDRQGHDINFCEKAKQFGFDIHVDTDLVIGHMGSPKIIDEEFYLKSRSEESVEKHNEEVKKQLSRSK